MGNRLPHGVIIYRNGEWGFGWYFDAIANYRAIHLGSTFRKLYEFTYE
jgi:hypothetical protein